MRRWSLQFQMQMILCGKKVEISRKVNTGGGTGRRSRGRRRVKRQKGSWGWGWAGKGDGRKESLEYSVRPLCQPAWCVMDNLICLFCCCSVTQLCSALFNPIDCSTPGLPVLYCLLEFTQTHVHWVSDAIQPSHLLLPASSALGLSQHQDLF